MLAAKIKEEIGVECDPSTFQRTYAGRNQKAAGAFVWVMVPEGKPDSLPENMWLIGSAEPASRLVKEKYHLDFDEKEGEIFGEEQEKDSNGRETSDRDKTVFCDREHLRQEAHRWRLSLRDHQRGNRRGARVRRFEKT